jgi:hypothetical protein
VTWVLLALLGLVVAIAVGIAASELTSRRIGLSSEPIRAGDALAPKSEYRTPKREGGHHGSGHHRGDDAGPAGGHEHGSDGDADHDDD